MIYCLTFFFILPLFLKQFIDEEIHWEANKNSPTKKPTTTWHWSSKPNPANIEMTAYALMSYIMGAKPYGSRLDHFKIVKWLIKNRNSYGGFGSTQV